MNDILKNFCAKKIDTQYSITEPWSDGEYSYATDGHIIIRVNRIESINESANSPPVQKMFSKYSSETWYELPSVTVDISPCSECKGKKKINGHECYYCEGEGEFINYQNVEIGEVLFSDYYIDKISKLPNARIAPISKTVPALFKFDGGGGLLMPLRGFGYNYNNY